MSQGLLAALLGALASAIWARPRTRWPAPEASPRRQRGDDGWLLRWRGLWAVLAGVGGALFVSGPWGLPSGVVVAAATWMWVGRAEPGGARRRREAASRDLPGLVHLVALALESGYDVAGSLRLACEALPGEAADQLAGVPDRLALGVAADGAWGALLDDRELAPLARAMVRAHRSGSSVTQEVARLARELERRAHLRVEERARAVGVKAAVPLGLCLLPAFLLIGVVPLVASLLRSLAL